jgi:SAM-dependent methyltransferase
MDRNFLKGKTVMELGCGTGLASIAASLLGATRVLATDGNPNVIELAQQNVNRNQVQQNVEPTLLSWGFLNACDYAETADLVIGSDLTYNSGTWRLLAETVSTVIKPGGMVLYLTLGHAGFNVEGELRGFLSVVQSEGQLEIITEREAVAAAAPSPLNNLSQTLLDTIKTPQEQSVLDGTGGVRVVLLFKPKLL